MLVWERKHLLMKVLPAISVPQLVRWGSLSVITLPTLTVSAQTNFCKAITSKTSAALHGCMVVDSFNSLDPSHSTNGKYDPAKRLDSADIACVSQTLSVITDTGNTRVYGHFGTGPSGKVTLSGTASVGSLAWVDGGSRGIQRGWYANDLQLQIPDAAQSSRAASSHSELLIGAHAGATVSYALTARWGLFAGALFQYAGDFNQRAGGKQAVINLGQSVLVPVGISFSF